MNTESLQEIVSTNKWIKVKQYTEPSPEFISVNSALPKPGTLCDIWVKGEEEFRAEPYEFVEGVGVSHEREAFQLIGLNKMGLYDMAFFLDENLVERWRVNRYHALEAHHVSETQFLINKNKELAAKLLAVAQHTSKRGEKAMSSRRFAKVPEYYEGLYEAYNDVSKLISE